MKRSAQPRGDLGGLRTYISLTAAQGRRGANMAVAFADYVSLHTRAKGRPADVLYYLAVHADAQSVVRDLSMQIIGERFSITGRQAKRLMQQLRELGELQTLSRGGGGHTNVYRITVSAMR